jgi:hypothetical protein
LQQSNAFVTKLNSAGSALIYSTYLGGTGDSAAISNSGGDAATFITLDAAGNAYLAGLTASEDFPLAGDSFQTTNNAWNNTGYNTFIAILNSTGESLTYSTYLGGSGTTDGIIDGDLPEGIALDTSGNVYVSGFATSSDFPVSAGAFQGKIGNPLAACGFVAKIAPSNKNLTYSTYLCGSTGDSAWGLALDSAGNAYVSGIANSHNFPITTNAFQPINYGVKPGASDAFLTELNPTLSGVVYSTFLGGSGYTYCPYPTVCVTLGELGGALVFDKSGNLYMTGTSSSPDFPITSGAYQPAHSSLRAAFVAKFNMASSAVQTETTMSLASSANPGPADAPVTFTAAVTPKTGTAIPAGNVAFRDRKSVV